MPQPTDIIKFDFCKPAPTLQSPNWICNLGAPATVHLINMLSPLLSSLAVRVANLSAFAQLAALSVKKDPVLVMVEVEEGGD